MEVIMNHLKSLSFTAVPKGAANPVMSRRLKLIERLEEQRALAQDPKYLPTVKRWVKGADGAKQLVESQRPIRPWWRVDATGATVLTVRYGFKTIEFDKGKAGITVPKDKLVSVLDTVIAAVRAGELDATLEQNKGRGVPRAKRAA
jgi:hypothetical protein